MPAGGATIKYSQVGFSGRAVERTAGLHDKLPGASGPSQESYAGNPCVRTQAASYRPDLYVDRHFFSLPVSPVEGPLSCREIQEKIDAEEKGKAEVKAKAKAMATALQTLGLIRIPKKVLSS